MVLDVAGPEGRGLTLGLTKGLAPALDLEAGGWATPSAISARPADEANG